MKQAVPCSSYASLSWSHTIFLCQINSHKVSQKPLSSPISSGPFLKTVVTADAVAVGGRFYADGILPVVSSVAVDPTPKKERFSQANCL